MNRLFDKLAVAILCTVGFGLNDSLIAPVAGLLISLSVSSLIQLFTGRRAAAVIIAGFAASCGFFPLLLCALPLMLYDSLWEKKWWLTLPALLALPRLNELQSGQLMIIAAGLFTAVVIFFRVSRLEETVGKLTMLRDEVTEKNIQLADRNRRLAEAQDNEVRIAALSERNRIAREIHDNVGHMLTRSLLQSAALLVINKDEQLREPLESLRATLDSTMTSVRQSVHDLHDDALDLRRVLDESIAAVGDRFAVSVDYDVSDGISGSYKLCIAGIVREALSNAVKHSDGDSIRIVLREHPAFYQLLIEDNGSCCEINETGIGLKNMADRAGSVGGRISFTPSEEGFRIFASLPKG